MAQRYTSPIALERLATGTCPECGFAGDQHDGGGGPLWCTLTDNGVAARLAQYAADQEAGQ
jgi:hypothetical protein